ncbi:hypothetical protein D3C81_1500630 [compost metagenome]
MYIGRDQRRRLAVRCNLQAQDVLFGRRNAVRHRACVLADYRELLVQHRVGGGEVEAAASILDLDDCPMGQGAQQQGVDGGTVALQDFCQFPRRQWSLAYRIDCLRNLAAGARGVSKGRFFHARRQKKGLFVNE